MAGPAEKPPVLPYQPVEPDEPPMARRLVVRFLRVLPWLPLYLTMSVALAWMVFSRLVLRGGEPFTISGLVADLFVAWILIGFCVTVYRLLHKPR